MRAYKRRTLFVVHEFLRFYKLNMLGGRQFGVRQVVMYLGLVEAGVQPTDQSAVS